LHEVIVEISADIARGDKIQAARVAEEILDNIADVLSATIANRKDAIESSKVVAKHVTSLYAIMATTLVEPILQKENFLDL
jgi:hypothetical protein